MEQKEKHKQISQAILLIDNLDFDAAFVKLQKQTLPKTIKNLDYSEAITKRDAIIQAIHYEIENSNDKMYTINRYARRLLGQKDTIENIQGGGYFFNLNLFGELWGLATAIKDEFAKAKANKLPQYLNLDWQQEIDRHRQMLEGRIAKSDSIEETLILISGKMNYWKSRLSATSNAKTLALISSFITELKGQSEQYQNMQRGKKTTPASIDKSFKFHSPRQKEYLKDILQELKDKRYLSDTIKQLQFQSIFKETELVKIEPLDWKGSIASLRYFIRKFDFKLPTIIVYKVTASCFQCNGKSIDWEKLKNNKQEGSKDKKNIDAIFTHYPLPK